MKDQQIDRILELIEGNNFKSISLDFFDTVVVRKVEKPIDIFFLLGGILLKKGLLKRINSPELFQNFRIKAEEKARKKSKEQFSWVEVNVKDIYDIFVQSGFVEQKDAGQCIELELELELNNIFLNPRIKPLLNYLNAHKKDYFVTSDTYFPRNFMEKIINKINGENEGNSQFSPSRLFVSSERRTGKGLELFNIVLQEIDIEPGDLLHIGDNAIGDYKKPLSYGIKAFHIPRFFSEHELILKLEKTFRFNSFKVDSHTQNIRSMSILHNPFKKTGAEYKWFDFGSFVLGPIYAHYILWLLNKAEKEKIKKIFFIAREGIFFKNIFDRVSKNYGITIETEILYFSRYVSFIHGINDLNYTVLDQAFRNQRIVPDIRGFSEIFLLKPNDIIEFSESSSKSLKDKVVRDKFFAFLLNKKELILNRLKKQQELIQHYIKQLNMGEDSLLVDIGWGGTIQSELTRIEPSLKDVQGCFLMLDNRRCLDAMLEEGFFIDSFLPTVNAPSNLFYSIIRSPAIVERTCMANHGTTIGFQEVNKEIKPIFENNGRPADEKEIKLIQEGIHCYLHQFFKYYSSMTDIYENMNSLQEYSQEILSRIILHPTSNEASMFSLISHEDNFGSKASLPIIDKQLKLSVKVLRELDDNWKEYHWPQGLLALKHSSYIPMFNDMQLHDAKYLYGNVTITNQKYAVKRKSIFSRLRNKLNRIKK